MLYTCLYLVDPYNMNALSVAFFTLVELSTSAHGQLLWYKETFGDQVPKNWKRVVPFLI